MQLFFTRVEGFTLPNAANGRDDVVTRALAAEIGLIEGLPFVLRANGIPDEHLNRFFRLLPGDGARSPNTWAAYARDIVAFARFMEQRQHREWNSATREDLLAYRFVRRDRNSAFRMSARSWNRALVAIERLFTWSLETGLVTELPYRPRSRRRHFAGTTSYPTSGSAITSNLREREDESHAIRCISAEDFRFFRDVGLRGLRPDGAEDPAWTGTNAFRDAMMAELLVTTGMRIQEASSLLTWEVRPLSELSLGSRRDVVLRLSPEVAKGNKARDVYIPLRVYKHLCDYISTERELSTAHPTTVRRLAGNPLIYVTRLPKNRYRVEGSQTPLPISGITPGHRRRLVERTDTGGVHPVAVFLSPAGTPLSTKAWDKVFERASQRCAAYGRALKVTPHMLRHTFAVNYLSALIKETIGLVGFQQLDTPGARAYQRMVGDPLRILQRRLGHASITSTFIYLDHLREPRELAETAAQMWDATIAQEAA
jgi:site-specific recombinase XerD